MAIVEKDYRKIQDLLHVAGVKRPLIVCTKSAHRLFIGEYLHNIENAVFFDAFSPNPQYTDIENGVELFRAQGCDGIVSVGGGSAIDVAKCIKLYCKMPADAFYLDEPLTDTGVFHLAVPTTAGSGSDATRFAVMYYQGEKQSIAHDSILPDAVILEPRFLETLPVYQKKVTMLDALCQAVESIWSVSANNQSVKFAEQAVALILANWRKYVQEDPTTYESIMFASYLAGRAINITKTTAPHAMSYKLTTLFGIAHGHAVALSLQGVWAYMAVNADEAVDPVALKRAFSKLIHLFGTRTIDQAAEQFAALYRMLQLPTPEVTPDQLDIMVNAVDRGRLQNHPIPLSAEALKAIYSAVLNVTEPDAEPADGALTVRQLQKIELSILDDIDRVCRKHRIPYYLGEGTLLGAIRHKGFIPWDDDMDLLMLREDYEQFLEIAQTELGDTYEVQHPTTVEGYWSPFIKVRLLDNSRFAQEHIAHLTDHNGPYVDIFPVDNVPQAWGFGQRMQSLVVRVMRGSLTSKLKCRRKKTKHEWACNIIGKVLPIRAIHWIIDHAFRFYNAEDNGYAVNLASYHKHQKQTVPMDWYGKPRYVPFEGRMSPIPAQAEKLLKRIYGDYMTLPPEHKRVIKHHFGNELLADQSDEE